MSLFDDPSIEKGVVGELERRAELEGAAGQNKVDISADQGIFDLGVTDTATGAAARQTDAGENGITDNPSDLTVAAKAFERAQEAKARRTKTRWRYRTAGTLAAVAIGTFAGSSILDKAGELIDKFKSGVAHEDVRISPHNALSKVETPNEAILVRGEGTGAVDISARPESDVPFVGVIFNKLVAPFLDRGTRISREGDVQIVSKRKAISLKPYDILNTKTGKIEHGIEAELDITKIYTKASMHADRDEEGDPRVDVDDDLLWKILKLDEPDYYAKRGVDAGDAADASFQDECSKVLRDIVPAGVMVNVEDSIRTTIGLLEASSEKSGQATADMLREMLAHKIEVVYVESYTTPDGRTATRPSSLPRLKFLDQAKYSKEKLAKSLGISSDNLDVDPAGRECTPTGPALEQYMKLRNKSNGIEQPAQPRL